MENKLAVLLGFHTGDTGSNARAYRPRFLNYLHMEIIIEGVFDLWSGAYS